MDSNGDLPLCEIASAKLGGRILLFELCLSKDLGFASCTRRSCDSAVISREFALCKAMSLLDAWVELNMKNYPILHYQHGEPLKGPQIPVLCRTEGQKR